MSRLVKKRSKCRKGNPHLRRLLIQAAHGAKLKRGSFYRNKFNKLKFKLGSANKAKVAIANRLARAIYKVLGGQSFKDLGYCRAVEHEDKIRILVNQLKALGVDIRHEGHQKVVSVKKLKVDATGVTFQ
jgi:hypothetical protein